MKIKKCLAFMMAAVISMTGTVSGYAYSTEELGDVLTEENIVSEAETGAVIVLPNAGSKGSLKLTAVMNKKKYNTTLKVTE